MALGPDHGGWKELYDALAELAKSCGAAFAFVVDEGNGLWCVGLPDTPPTTATRLQDRAADRFYRTEMVPRLAAVRKGARVDVAKTDGDDRYVALSFAGIYVLVVWFEGPFEPALVRARMRRTLPRVEALTLGLPPPGGPGPNEGAGKLRA